jgi:hypothetical protein
MDALSKWRTSLSAKNQIPNSKSKIQPYWECSMEQTNDPQTRFPLAVAGKFHRPPASVIEVRFQRGLHLPELDLWLDPWDAKPRAFVSHAHADHFARHESALCSDVTAALVRKRFHLAESRNPSRTTGT